MAMSFVVFGLGLTHRKDRPLLEPALVSDKLTLQQSMMRLHKRKSSP